MPVNRGPAIVCASTQYWDEAWFRKHHFMKRLSGRRPVVYVEPSRSILRSAPPGLPTSMHNPLLVPRVRRIDERLWVLTPPRGLPFWTRPGVSALQYRLLGGRIRSALQRLGFDRIWLWLYNPLYIQSSVTLRPERVIFDLVDDLGAYAAGASSRKTVERCVDAAMERADLVLATSPILADRYAARTHEGKIHVVPNGVADAWIDMEPSEPPDEISRLPHPIVGLVGALFGYLDYRLLAHVARTFSTGSLVLVGPVLDEGAVAVLAREPNVHLIGRRPQAEIPRWIASFDVCLAPFKPGPVRTAVNPLKIYEYLALGRPVVATPLESILNEPIARFIRFAEEPVDFAQAVGAAIQDGEPQARREAARDYGWARLSARVESLLDEAAARWDRSDGA